MKIFILGICLLTGDSRTIIDCALMSSAAPMTAVECAHHEKTMADKMLEQFRTRSGMLNAKKVDVGICVAPEDVDRTLPLVEDTLFNKIEALRKSIDATQN